MAQSITLQSGSVFAGNPITFLVRPTDLSITPSFHRVYAEVTCGMSGGDYETIKLFETVTREGSDVEIDISSALHTALDDYEYTPNATQYPYVSWQIRCYDEYMDSNGEIHTEVGEIYFPSKTTYYRCIAGSFSDMERLKSGATKSVKNLSCKPTSLPEKVKVGETFAYTSPYSTAQTLEKSASLVPPTSRQANVTKAGMQTLGYQSVYALPADDPQERQQFRFINRFGVLESISVPVAHGNSVHYDTEQYIIARRESFNKFSRLGVTKQNDRESWKCSTDVLNEDWLRWYLHEFLMSEHIWIYISNVWVPCLVVPDEEITFKDTTKNDYYSVTFTAQLGITGNPYV